MSTASNHMDNDNDNDNHIHNNQQKDAQQEKDVPILPHHQQQQQQQRQQQDSFPSISFSIGTSKKKSKPQSHQDRPLIRFESHHPNDESITTIATIAEQRSQERQKLGIQLVIPLPAENGHDKGDNNDDGNDDKDGGNAKLPLLSRARRNKVHPVMTTLRPSSPRNEQRQEHPDPSGQGPISSETQQEKEIPQPTTTEQDLDHQAMEALLQDASIKREQSSTTNVSSSTTEPLIVVPTHTHTTNQTTQDSSSNDDKDEVWNYKRDLESSAPDMDVTSDAYISVPISEFGAAMLRGMGWKGEEGTDSADPSGASSGTERRIVPRPARLGLGAIPLPPSMKELQKNGAGVGADVGLSSQHQASGNGSSHANKRHWRGRKGGTMSDLSHITRQEEEERKWKEHLLEKEKKDMQVTLQVGSIVRCGNEDVEKNGDMDSNWRAKVVKIAGVPGLNRILIRYEGDATKTNVSVKKSSVVLVPRSELMENPFVENSQPSKDDDARERDETVHRDDHHPRKHAKHDNRPRDREDHDHDRKKRHSSSKRKHTHNPDHPQPRDKRICHSSTTADHWLLTNIRVRVISHKIDKGRYFKEKGIVIDVLKRGQEATIQMSNGCILERIPERYLETALPKAGGNVIVLTGSHKYEKGKLLERNSERGKGVVQLFDDMNVITLSLDDIAEYCGPLDDTLDDY